jgi:TPR repeat protein
MRSRRLLSACVLLTIALATPARPAQAPAAPAESQGPDLRQAEEQVRALRAALKDPATPPESWGALMMAEMVVLRMRALQAAGGGPLDEAALAGEQRKLRDRVFAEWKAARPADATPYLAEMQGTVPPEKMDDALLALLPRFQDDFRLLSRCVQILVQREQTKSAAELVEAALQRHPDRFEAYGLAIRFYGQLENESRQRELAEAWIDHLPGDPNGLRAYLGTPSAGRDPREAAARVERFVGARGAADSSRVEVCGWLLTAEGGAYRDAALRCLTDAAASTRDAQVRTRAAGLLAGAGGGTEQDWERSLAELPPERRQGAIVAAMSALGEGSCDRKMALLRRLPPPAGVAGGSVSERFGALRGCETDPAARAAFLDAVAHAPAAELTNLLLRWFPKVNGSFQEDGDFGLAPQIVAALEARRQPEAGKACEAELWRALDEAYQLAGWEDRRAAHLAAWSAARLTPPSGERLAWLAEYRAAHDGPAAAIATLRAAWGKSHDEAVAAALGDALLAAGKLDDLTALVDELAARAAASEVSHPTVGFLALRLRARGTLVRQGPAAALPAYEAWVEQAPYLKREEAAEHVFVVAAARGPAAAETAAQALCAKPSMQSGSAAPTQCAADLLATLGHGQGALRLLEAAAQRAPEDLRLQASFAQAAEQAGELERAETAYRRLLAADPKSESSWSGLGRIAERRGDPRELQTLLRQAEQARGEQPPALVLSLARVELARGEPQRAADLLLALRERFPNAYLGEDELRQAYRDLAAATPSAAAAPAAPAAPPPPSSPPLARLPRPGVRLAAFHFAAPAAAGVRPPSAEDLRAMRESEAAMLGIGAPVNEARGREIARRLAAQGNAYANIRLSIWQQAGTLGMTADARQAAATARPYLPALKAAAEAGEPYAEYLWGTVLLRGIGVPKAAAEGGTWLRKAAAGNEPWALHNLGWMAENGDGAPRDLQEALRWYQKGAAAGNAHSLVSLAELRINGDPAVRQPAEGVQWLAKAAEKGLPEAEPWYGAVLLYGLPGVAADPVRARPWLEKGAARETDSALYDLGAALLEGVGGPADPRRAVALLERVAAKGNARAMWQLAWQSALGQGVPHDGKRGEQWIERAAGRGYDEPGMILGTHADQGEAFRRAFLRDLAALEKFAAAGDAFAGGLLARLYQMGIGVKEDDARAVALARRAATGGSVEGMRVLAWQYRMGQGVEADAAQAAAWFRRCAEGGNSYCMMWYSQALFRGDGGKLDPVAALTWLERAGELGNAWAVRDLGNFYDAGTRGIPRDLAKATYWKRKALAFDDEESRGWLIAHHLME